MTRAQRIALVADYLRSKEDKAGWINDYLFVASEAEADELLNIAESMEFSQIGEWAIDKLVSHYLPQAEQWRIDHSDRAA